MVTRHGSSTFMNRLLLVLLLGGAFCLSAGAVMYVALRGRTVDVPSVIGKSEEGAADLLDSAGLRMVVKSRVHDEIIPADAVCDQYPPAGTTVKSGQLVRVSLSLGAEPKK